MDKGINSLFNFLQKLEGAKPVRETREGPPSEFSMIWILDNMQNIPTKDCCTGRREHLNNFLRFSDRIEKAYLTIPDEKINICGIFISIMSTGLFEKRYNAGDANTNAVQLTGLREIAHLSYDFVFIPDLVDGEIPKPISLSHFLQDLRKRRTC